ncbi:Protein kinase of the Mitotic Exit Network [Dimargaris cristalligena]|nr:Protein kinase of the Mitotic Exit Network [Dimargaris cristalligena]
MSFAMALSGAGRYKPDRLLDMRREEQRQQNHRAATEFIESVLGEKLATGDLHAELQDGVVLCRIINSLRPGTIKQIALKNLPFAKMENISSFLAAAQYLGVPGSDLFQTVDLYEGKNITKVVSTILSIARVIAGIPLGRRRHVHTADRHLPDKWPATTPVKDDYRGSPSSSHSLSPLRPMTGTDSTDTLIAELSTIPSPAIASARAVVFLDAHVPSRPSATSPPKSREGTLVDRPQLSIQTRGTRIPSGGAQSAPPIESFPTPEATSRSSTEAPYNGRGTDIFRVDRGCLSAGPDSREVITLYSNHSQSVVQYQIGNCIGKGQFGAVYRSLNLETGQMVAVKRIPLECQVEEQTDAIMKEVELLQSLRHSRVVQYEGFIKTPTDLNIVMEYVENGSLYHTLKSFGAFPEKLVLAYIVKIIEGLIYLHDKQVVHCDLKAANILTTKKGNTKLSDFGVSLNLKLADPSEDSAVAGTPNWMAPEIIQLEGACTASDIWSLGCTIVELLTGKPPYADMMQMTTLFRIVEDDCPPLPEGISDHLRDFLRACFQKDPALRPTARELMMLPWIAEYSKNKRELQSLRRKHSVHVSRHVSRLQAVSDLFPSSSRDTPSPTPTNKSVRRAPSSTRLGGKLLKPQLHPSQKLQAIRRRISRSYKRPSFRRFHIRSRSRLSDNSRSSSLLPVSRSDLSHQPTPSSSQPMDTAPSTQGSTTTIPNLLDAYALNQHDRFQVGSRGQPVPRNRSQSNFRHRVNTRAFRVDSFDLASSGSSTTPNELADSLASLSSNDIDGPLPPKHRFVATPVNPESSCDGCQRPLDSKVIMCTTCNLACHIGCRLRLANPCNMNTEKLLLLHNHPDHRHGPPPGQSAGVEASTMGPRPKPVTRKARSEGHTLSMVEPYDTESGPFKSTPGPPRTAPLTSDGRGFPLSMAGDPHASFYPPPSNGARARAATESSHSSFPLRRPSRIYKDNTSIAHLYDLNVDSSRHLLHRRIDEAYEGDIESSRTSLYSAGIRQSFLSDWVDIDESQIAYLPSEQYDSQRGISIRLGSKRWGQRPAKPEIPKYPYYHPDASQSSSPTKYMGISPRVAVNGAYYKGEGGGPAPVSTPGAATIAATRAASAAVAAAVASGPIPSPRIPHPATQPVDPSFPPASPTTPLPLAHKSRTNLFLRSRPTSWSKKPVFKSPTVLRAQALYEELALESPAYRSKPGSTFRVFTNPRPTCLGSTTSGGSSGGGIGSGAIDGDENRSRSASASADGEVHFYPPNPRDAYYYQQKLPHMGRERAVTDAMLRSHSIASVSSDDSSIRIMQGRSIAGVMNSDGGLQGELPPTHIWCPPRLAMGPKRKKKSKEDDCHVM